MTPLSPLARDLEAAAEHSQGVDSQAVSASLKAGETVAGNGRPTLTATACQEAIMADRAASAGAVDESTRLSRNMGEPPENLKPNWQPIGALARALTAAAARRRGAE